MHASHILYRAACIAHIYLQSDYWILFAMLRIPREKNTIVFDRHLPPVASVRPGEVFVVETEDSRS